MTIIIINGYKFDIDEIEKHLPALHSMIRDKQGAASKRTAEGDIKVNLELDHDISYAKQYLDDPDHYIPIGDSEQGDRARKALDSFGIKDVGKIRSSYEILEMIEPHTMFRVSSNGYYVGDFTFTFNHEKGIPKTLVMEIFDNHIEKDDTKLMSYIAKKMKKVKCDTVYYKDIRDIIKFSYKNDKKNRDNVYWLATFLGSVSEHCADQHNPVVKETYCSENVEKEEVDARIVEVIDESDRFELVWEDDDEECSDDDTVVSEEEPSS
jgi:hypothetical protein